MRWWFALLLGMMLAGCADAPAASEPDPAPVVSDPSDFESSAAGSHIHDYWGGAQTLRLLEQEDGCTGCTVTYSGDKGALLGWFRPEPDHVVPQGTATVQVTASWTVASGDFDGVGLFVKTANTTSAQFVGVLAQDVPLRFDSTNPDNDPPHHRLSLWEFEVRGLPSGDGSTSASNFNVQLRVEVERGLPIPLFPPHPDPWQGATELVLHSSQRVVEQQLETPVYWSCSGCLGAHPPDDGATVPPSASEVEVRMEVLDGTPATFDLMVHGADTWEYEQVTADEEDGRVFVWHLPVDGRPDSPYAKQSLWDLYLINDSPAPAKYWEGSYEITVKALR